MNDFNVIRVAVNSAVERRVRPVLERSERQLAAQQSLIDRLRFLSPAILLQEALNDVSGTGVARHRHFHATSRSLSPGVASVLRPLIFRKAQLASFAAVPRFSYEEQPVDRVTSRVATSRAFVLATTVVLAIVGLGKLRHYSSQETGLVFPTAPAGSPAILPPP